MSFLEPIVKLSNAVNSINEKYMALTYQEQSDLTIFGRLRYYNWTFEAWALGAVALVYATYLFGTRVNKSRASQLFQALAKGFEDLAFAKIGFSTNTAKNELFVAENNNTWFTSFVTGRACIESITVRAHLLARFNPMSILMEKVLGLFFSSLVADALDEFVEVTIVPNGVYVTSSAADLPKETNASANVVSKFKFISSIVNKGDMTKAREDNYFLSLTHTSESEKLPFEYVFMSESNQLSSIFEHYGGPEFKQLLSRCAHFLSYVAFTDLPEEKPVTDKLWERSQQPRCIIKTKMVTGSVDLASLNELIKAVVNIFDSASQEYAQNPAKAFVTNDMLRKSANLRSQELAKIAKVMKQAERDLLQEKKQDQEREKRRDLRSKMSGEEQDRLEQKMREKRERRQRNRQKVRM
ncbi:LANO_0A01948g1_1 [Lachancea nothofagi CBS 11611]|uniref:LANO_0A01948g1_1 n=1 Tax=Lachancea nothofagi CBS 11611 TaxID=1266666 RepID=A0A1G4INM2_9SACH|nr:LANO_0A01948g1_1 [Lachancea nothofagi CBS 11611]